MVPAEPLRVLVWASYPALRAGLSKLMREGGFEVTGELGAATGSEATDVAAHVLIADIGNDSEEREVTRLAQLLLLPSIVLVQSGDPRPVTARDLEMPGGLISRESTSEELATVIRAVAAGFSVLDPALALGLTNESSGSRADRVAPATGLTPRELDVLRWIALGLPNKAIALKLGISEHTVKFHIGSILSKLDARSRTEAVTIAARLGLLTL